jgi:hypothetical protein
MTKTARSAGSRERLRSGELSQDQLVEMAAERNNVVQEYRITLQVVKGHQ